MMLSFAARQWLLFFLLVIPGAVCFGICLYYALLDWAELQKAYEGFARLGNNAPLNQLFAAEAAQNIHRINLFADGVWALLGGVIAAIGLHGMCVNAPSAATLCPHCVPTVAQKGFPINGTGKTEI